MEHNYYIQIFVLLLTGIANATETDVTYIINSLISEYDKSIRPNFQKGAVNISLSAYILDVYEISEVNHEFKVNMYLRQSWTDDRLKFIAPENMSSIQLDWQQLDHIWIPDTFILNERKVTTATDMKGNHIQFTKISPNGSITRSVRMAIIASCKMDLGWFPFDAQKCSLDMESYGYTGSELIYHWTKKSKAIELSREISSLKYYITAVRPTEFLITLSGAASNTYSRVSIDFYLSRARTRYIQDIYIPLMILTLASICSFLMNSPLSRLQFSIFLMVVVIVFTAICNGNSEITKVSCHTALDSFSCACVVFATIVVCVNVGSYVGHREKQPERIRMESMGDGEDEDLHTINHAEDHDETERTKLQNGPPLLSNQYEKMIIRNCNKCELIVPILFLVFNLCYWIVVCIASQRFPENVSIEPDSIHE